MENSKHPGREYVRTLQDCFLVTGRASNRHRCVVHDVLSNNLLSLRYLSPARKSSEVYLKQILIHLLLALDFLHSECHIVHTGKFIPFISHAFEDVDKILDLKEESILLGLSDSSILEKIDTRVIAGSSLYKSVNG